MNDPRNNQRVRPGGSDVMAEMMSLIEENVLPPNASEAARNLHRQLQDEQHSLDRAAGSSEDGDEPVHRYAPPHRSKKKVRDAEGNEIAVGSAGRFGHVDDTSLTARQEISNYNKASRRMDVAPPLPTEQARALTPGLSGAPRQPAPDELTKPNDVRESVIRQREITPNHTDLELPSNYQAYPFSELFMRRFRASEFELIAEWVQSSPQRDDLILRAIDATLSQSIYDLTIPDGIYLMHFHRDYSYPKSPQFMEWECQPHFDGVTDYPGCGHTNLTELKVRNLHVRTLNELGFDYQQLRPELDLPRMSLYLEYVQLQKDMVAHAAYLQRKLQHDLRVSMYEAGETDDEPTKPPRPPKLTYPAAQLQLYSAAMWVRPGNTLEEKLQFLREQEDGELMQEALNLSRNVVYGVQEGAAVDCAQCGAQRQFLVRLEPASFVP